MEELIEKYNELVSSEDQIERVQGGFVWHGRKWLLEDLDIMQTIIIALIEAKQNN